MARKMNQKQLDAVRELNRQRWNALVARDEKQYAKEQANRKPAKLRSVK